MSQENQGIIQKKTTPRTNLPECVNLDGIVLKASTPTALIGVKRPFPTEDIFLRRSPSLTHLFQRLLRWNTTIHETDTPKILQMRAVLVLPGYIS
ncbi:MAG: hypothetical protein HRU72_08365 [Planctomycetia bacterium]|nr:MAG: hypothetical protein HRU72_08365 [Planctomycetia bacterium]TVL95617.1 MAG: hypothetical protein CV082_10005 [Candidatus Brocadia sp. BL1]